MLSEEDVQPPSASGSLCLCEHTCAVSQPAHRAAVCYEWAWHIEPISERAQPHGLQAPHAPSLAKFSSSPGNRAFPVSRVVGTSFGNSHYLVYSPEPFLSGPLRKPGIWKLFLLFENELKLVLIYFHASLTQQKLWESVRLLPLLQQTWPDLHWTVDPGCRQTVKWTWWQRMCSFYTQCFWPVRDWKRLQERLSLASTLPPFRKFLPHKI